MLSLFLQTSSASKSSVIFEYGFIIFPILLVILLLALVKWAASRYKTIPPNKIGIVSGGKHNVEILDAAGKVLRTEVVGFKIYTGGGVLVWPVVNRWDEMEMKPMQIPVEVNDAANKNGVMVTAKGSATISFDSSPAGQLNAVRKFLGMPIEQITKIIRETLEGQLRGIIGTMTIEDLNSDREGFNRGVLTGSEHELLKLGLKIEILTIQHLSDNEGYLQSLGKKRVAEVKRDAQIGEAEAQRDAAIAASNAKMEAQKVTAENDIVIAEAQKDRDLKVAQFKALTDREQALAELAGAQATAEGDLKLRQAKIQAEEAETEARTKLAEKEAGRREQELIAQVIRPAEAEAKALQTKTASEKAAAIIRAQSEQETAALKAEAVRVGAEAEASATQRKGEGLAKAEQAKQEANAAGHKAQKLAEAAALEAFANAMRLELVAKAEGEGAMLTARANGTKAQLLAEAEGKAQLAEALAKLDEGGRVLQIMQALPLVAEAFGNALAKTLGPDGAAAIFGEMAKPMGSVDSIHIVDFGGSGNSGAGALSKLTSVGPQMLFQLIASAKAAGFDLNALLKPLGLSTDLLSNLNFGGGSTNAAEQNTEEKK